MALPSHRRGAHFAIVAIAVALAVSIMVFTVIGIRAARTKSLAALESQGRSFLQALVAAGDLSLKANAYLWNNLRDNLSANAKGLLRDNTHLPPLPPNDSATVVAYCLFDNRLRLLTRSVSPDFDDDLFARVGLTERLPGLFTPDGVHELFWRTFDSTGASFASLAIVDSSRTIGACLIAEVSALKRREDEIGIGALIRRLGSASEVRYLFFQNSAGLVFASTSIDSTMGIERDPFLAETMGSDSIATRVIEHDGADALEIVAPYESGQYGRGVYRLGLSLAVYHELKGQYDRQMGLFGGALILAVTLIGLYLSARQKREALGIELTRSGAISRAIIESMDAGVIAISDTGIVEAINSRLKKMFPALESRAIGSIVTTQDISDSFHQSIAVGSDTAPHTQEFTKTTNGERRFYLLSSARYLSGASRERVASEGESARVVGGRVMVVADYTEQRALEEAMRRRERISEMGDLTAGVAHEIRNPLNAISLAAQRLTLETSESEMARQPESAKMLGIIREETRRLNGIVTRFLELTRAPKPSVLAQPLRALLEDWRSGIVNNSAPTEMVIIDSGAELSVLCDPDTLNQALTILLINAREATGGSKRTSAQPLRIHISVVSKRESVEVGFADNGPGISRSAADKIFAPYYTTKETGAGLGLAICHRLIGDMGGALTLDHEYESGARFIITLPLDAH